MEVIDRIKEVISQNNVSSREFASMIGINYVTLTQQLNGKRGASLEVTNAVLKAFPNISAEWLIRGIGNMIKSSNAINIEDIKEGDYQGSIVYDIDATCGTDPRDILFTQDNIIGCVNLPGISKESVIIRANGDSMEPRIYDGNMVVIREIHSWDDIFYGQIYLILLDEYRMIKYIRKCQEDEDNYIILRSENKNYDDIKLHKSKIRKLFLVENVLSLKSQL